MELTGTTKRDFETWFNTMYGMKLEDFCSLPDEMKYGVFERFADLKQIEIHITPTKEYLKEFYLKVGHIEMYVENRITAQQYAIMEFNKIYNNT